LGNGCCWAAAAKIGKDKANSARALEKRTDIRVKQILLKLGEDSRLLAYTRP
jgi:hypothetical protein